MTSRAWRHDEPLCSERADRGIAVVAAVECDGGHQLSQQSDDRGGDGAFRSKSSSSDNRQPGVTSETSSRRSGEGTTP
jgi:hypothetical protein